MKSRYVGILLFSYFTRISLTFISSFLPFVYFLMPLIPAFFSFPFFILLSLILAFFSFPLLFPSFSYSRFLFISLGSALSSLFSLYHFFVYFLILSYSHFLFLAFRSIILPLILAFSSSPLFHPYHSYSVFHFLIFHIPTSFSSPFVSSLFLFSLLSFPLPSFISSSLLSSHPLPLLLQRCPCPRRTCLSWRPATTRS